ncbi:MAG: helix-turn-helix transcriptional regulator [Deltaproteobacteria bacterium]|nr:helix-turn-helix transcriptional regulator [Deltaproteobacteria bacterium]
MGNREHWADLINAVFDSTLGDEGTRSLEQVVDWLGGGAAILGTLDLRTRICPSFALVRFDREVFFRTVHTEVNAWTPCMSTLPAGTVINSEQLLPFPKLVRSDFYQEFLRPLNIAYAMGCNLGAGEGSVLTSILLLRPRRRGPFERPEMARLRRLFPHLRHATLLSQRLGSSVGIHRNILDVLERLSLGVFLVDSEGRVSFMNASANELVARRDGLSVEGGELTAGQRQEAIELRAMVAGLVSAHAGSVASPQCSMTVSRPSLARPFSVVGASLPPRGFPWDSLRLRFRAALFVSDPEAREETNAQALRRLYGLTPAEARVALAIGAGGGIQQAADELDLSRNTVRVHLQRIFDKTGARRQSELVRLLLVGPPKIRLQA